MGFLVLPWEVNRPEALLGVVCVSRFHLLLKERLNHWDCHSHAGMASGLIFLMRGIQPLGIQAETVFLLMPLSISLVRPESGVRGRRNPENLSWTWGHPTRVPFFMSVICANCRENGYVLDVCAQAHCWHWARSLRFQRGWVNLLIAVKDENKKSPPL